MYKKCRIILIKSNEDANVGQNNWYLPNSQQLVIDNKLSHLYILSDDNLIEGDWCLQFHKTNINILVNVVKYKYYGEGSYYFKKIIATTDKSLLTEIDCPDCIEGCEVFHAICLPSIPEYFIKYYIEQYNLGNVIQEVEVLYDVFSNIETFPGFNSTEININIDIFIRCEAALRVEKVYSKTEVIELFEQFERDRGNYYPEDAAHLLPLNTWIEQNLK